MIINGKSIRGIFLYENDLEFEKDDFVVSGNSIYICTAQYPTNRINKTVSGEDPKSSSRNFKIYPGEMISTTDEYYNYKEGDEDKFISSFVVSEILQNLHHGLSITGVIEGDGTPLDDIMKSQSINNGTFYISPTVAQLQDILPVIGPIDSEDTKKYNLILRQYTYIGLKSENNITSDRYVRVQELINPYSGYTAYRYTTKDEDSGEFGNIISTWRTSYTYSGIGERPDEIVYRLRALESFYTTRMNQMSSELESLKDSFRFKKLPLELEGDYAPNYKILVPRNKLGIVTLTVDNSNGLYKTISYDLTEFGSAPGKTIFILLDNSNRMRFYNNNSADDYIHIGLPSYHNLIDAYYREYYGS